ncbi:uncharacterized protein PV07_05357 [Cladophialophora immunda]|uniref:Uncharacterized protein n=1 Tax=Cladophialophora immunda TaxID=569365 RepID=A0A0D2CHC1_9EURO|nr:uncharacterized protein PV07_05357 [Cladophialophora immunda]KIW29545.1 hypothetical protein PV07_05357 [Cladophialophora immunda]
MFSLGSQTALVTGGSQGIGCALTVGLAEAGANVVVFDINPPSTNFQSLSATYGVATAYQQLDVSNVPALKESFRIINTFCEENDGLDICVACAGVNQVVDFLETDESIFDRIMRINVKGA